MIVGTTKKSMKMYKFKVNLAFFLFTFQLLNYKVQLLSVFPCNCQIQKLELLKEPPNPQYMLNIQRRSGAANNLVLREVDNLKIAQVTLCNINCHSQVLRKVLLGGKNDNCLFLWETGEEETVHFKQQVTKAKVNDDSAKKRKYFLEKKPDKPLGSIWFHAILVFFMH